MKTCTASTTTGAEQLLQPDHHEEGSCPSSGLAPRVTLNENPMSTTPSNWRRQLTTLHEERPYVPSAPVGFVPANNATNFNSRTTSTPSRRSSSATPAWLRAIDTFRDSELSVNYGCLLRRYHRRARRTVMKFVEDPTTRTRHPGSIVRSYHWHDLA